MHTKFKYLNTLADGSSTQTSETYVFNMPKLMSSANRRAYHNVDAQGNAQLYTIAAKLYATKGEMLITAAPNIYTTRRAIKAWHDARVRMYKRAGVSMKSLGPYARHLRPFLDVNHENGTTNEADTEDTSAFGITPNFQGQEWTYSRAAVTAPQENVVTGEAVYSSDLVDTYSFTILGDSVLESTTPDSPDESTAGSDEDSFVSVGMVSEWLDSFKRRQPEAGGNYQVDSDNALLQLLSDRVSSEEVLELAEDAQEELMPWDRDGSQYTSAYLAGYAKSVSTESSTVVFQAPCGLFNVALANDHTEDNLQVDFEVLDIKDM